MTNSPFNAAPGAVAAALPCGGADGTQAVKTNVKRKAINKPKRGNMK
jgi:hypothetical protein